MDGIEVSVKGIATDVAAMSGKVTVISDTMGNLTGRVLKNMGKIPSEIDG